MIRSLCLGSVALLLGCGSSEFPVAEMDDAVAADTVASGGDSIATTDTPVDSTTTTDTGSPGGDAIPSSACGNGALEAWNAEECDDGNKTAGDGCSPTCQLELVGASCGNGTIEGPLEVCDDSNTTNGDGCNPTCNLKNTTTTFLTGTTGTAGLAVDNTSLWIVDGTFRLRKVDIATKAITNIAGTGTSGTTDNAAGLSATIGNVSSITTDGKTVWIADSRRIRAIDVAAPNAVKTIAGSGVQGYADGTGAAATFDDPRGLTYFNGKLYMVDAARPAIRSIDPTTGVVVTLAGSPTALPGSTVDGCGTAARFVSPRYIASDNSGMLYIADTNGAILRAFNTATNCVTSFAGSGTAGYVDGIGKAAAIHRPRGMTSDGTSLYFAEFNQHTIRQAVLATASITTNVGKHCGGAATCAGGYAEGIGTAARLNSPWSIVYHWPTRSLFVADSGNNVVRRIQ